MITHYDLFAGIGGFSLALEEVFPDAAIKSIFCEWEPFPTAVLKRHWPDGEYWGDIKELVDHTEQSGLEGHGNDKTTEGRQESGGSAATPARGIDFTIVTGGFPCQPFSHAGRRKGTADDRTNGDACPCGELCSIIGVCNGDTTTSVQDARKDPAEQSTATEWKSTPDSANPARQSIKQSGEQPIGSEDEQQRGHGHSNTRPRYSNDMAGNVSAVGRATEHFSQSTTRTEEETRNGNESTTRHGDSSSRTTTRRTSTKSCATTATTPSISTESVHTSNRDFTIVTGGFPCQPFSHAGRRKGTADDRYQWPNMFSVIKNVQPEWVIAENVRGLVTWDAGVVLETVCVDLENEGYEVWPLIIPAVAVGAPHRRDRVWIIANRTGDRRVGRRPAAQDEEGHAKEPGQAGELAGRPERPRGDDADARSAGLEEAWTSQQAEGSRGSRHGHAYPDWSRNWQEVAFATCDDAVDDGLPRIVDGVPYSYAKWRQASLKAYGNGIVHQVAAEIIRAIKETM